MASETDEFLPVVEQLDNSDTSSESEAEVLESQAEAEVSEAEAEVSESEAEVSESEAEVSESEAEVSESEVEVLESEVEVSESEVEVSESEVEVLESEVEVSESEAEVSESEVEVEVLESEVEVSESEAEESESEAEESESESEAEADEIAELLQLVQEHGLVNRLDFVKALDDKLAFNFVEFFESIDQQERSACLERFFDCLADTDTFDSVLQQLCSCFASIARGLHESDDWKEERDRLVSELFSFLDQKESPAHIRAAGWSILGRSPKAILDRACSDEMVIDQLEWDINDEDFDLAFEASCCLISMTMHVFEDDEKLESLDLAWRHLASVLKKFVIPGKEKLLHRLHAANDYESLHFLLDRYRGSMLEEAVLPCAVGMLRERERPIRTLCLQLISQLTVTTKSMKKVAEALPEMLWWQFQTGVDPDDDPMWPAMELMCFNLLDDCSSDLATSFTEYLLAPLPDMSTEPRSTAAKESAPFFIAAVASEAHRQDDVVLDGILALIEFGLTHRDAEVRRAYGYVATRLDHLWDSSEAPYVYFEPSLLSEEEDCVAQVFAYKRIPAYINHLDVPPTTSDIGDLLLDWVSVLEKELDYFTETKDGSTLKTVLESLLEVLVSTGSSGEQGKWVIPALKKLVFSIIALKSKPSDLFKPTESDLKILPTMALDCITRVLPPEGKPFAHEQVHEHVPWMMDVLVKLQPLCHAHGLSKWELELAERLQAVWHAVTDLTRQGSDIFPDAMTRAVDALLWKATARLPVEQLENVPEAKDMACSSRKVYCVDMGRIFCVDEEGLRSKVEAVIELKEYYLRDVEEISEPQLVRLAKAMVELVVKSPIKGYQGVKSFETDRRYSSVSRQAASLMGVLLDRLVPKGINEIPVILEQKNLVVRLWDAIKRPLLDALRNCKWRFCPNDLLCTLSYFVLHLPEDHNLIAMLHLPEDEVIGDIVPSLVSILSKGIDMLLFYKSRGIVPCDDDHEINRGEARDEREESQRLQSFDGVFRLIEAIVENCNVDRAQRVLELLAGHCEAFTAPDASPVLLQSGVRWLMSWLHWAGSNLPAQIDWLPGRLLALLKCTSAELMEQDAGSNGAVFETKFGSDVALDLMGDVGLLLEDIAPVIVQDSKAAAAALDELSAILEGCVIISDDEQLEMTERNEIRETLTGVIIWNSSVILWIVKEVSTSDEALSEVAARAMKIVFSTFLAFNCGHVLTANIKELVELFEAKHPAIMNRATEMVELARRTQLSSDFRNRLNNLEIFSGHHL